MQTNISKKLIINVITLGCSKNIVDSERMGTQLKTVNQQVQYDNIKKSDIVIINTCGFIEDSKVESIKTILEYAEQKKQQKIKQLFVAGCLVSRYKNELKQDIPEVDGWYTNIEMELLIKELNPDYRKELFQNRLLSTPSHYAYVKISEGCNRTCAFCAIPLIRGKHISRNVENIVQEISQLVNQGVKEIILIAQELTYYGLDIYKKRMLSILLEKVANIQGIKRIRLHYAYPNNFPFEILEVMNKYESICNYLDMPIQHISNHLLEGMKRQTTKEEIEHTIQKIRAIIPNICLRTTLIVGFPGETQEDVDELQKFLEKYRFDRVGIFTYSHEEGTSAFQEKDTLSTQEKQQRKEQLMLAQQQISYEKNKAKIGMIISVMIDRKEAGVYLGRSEFDSPEVDNEIIIRTKNKLKIGEILPVKIIQAYDYDLEGIALNYKEGGEYINYL
ncbi:MAG: 30S ribosomal protein S12 methylthiotransferase RimO [Chitinophagaceae bacterium]